MIVVVTTKSGHHVLEPSIDRDTPKRSETMGQTIGSPDVVTRDRKYHNEAHWAKALGFESARKLRRSLEGDRFADLAAQASSMNPAEFISQVSVGSTNVSLALLAEVVSFDRPIRPTSTSRVGLLEKSMFDVGILATDAPLTVGMELPAEAERGKEVSFVLLNGFHRVEACFSLFRAYMARNKHDWTSSSWTVPDDAEERRATFCRTSVQMEILYLGDAAEDVRIQTALALNHGNAASSPTNLADMVTMVKALRKTGKSAEYISGALFPDLRGDSRRVYAAAVGKLAACDRSVKLITKYFNDVADVSSKPFFTASKIQKEIGPIRRHLFGAAEFFYTRWVITHQTRVEGVLSAGMSSAARERMVSCLKPIEIARGAVHDALSDIRQPDEVGLEPSPADRVGLIVDELVRSLLEVAWDSWVGSTGATNVTNAVVTLADGILADTISMALDACERDGHQPTQFPVQECRDLLTRSKFGGKGRQASGDPSKKDDEANVLAEESYRAPAMDATVSFANNGLTYLPAAGTTPTLHTEGKRQWEHAPPSIVLLGEFTVPHIEEGLQHNAGGKGLRQPYISLFVWHVGFSGPSDRLTKILQELVRKNLLLPDARVLLFEGPQSCYGTWRVFSREISEEFEAMTAAVISAMPVRPGPNPDQWTAFPLEVRVGDAYAGPAASRTTTGDFQEVHVNSSTEPPDIYHATVVHEGTPRVRTKSMRLLTTGRTDSQTRSDIGSRLDRASQPSVETYMAIIYRTRASVSKGQILVSFDPYAAWAEAAAATGIPCLTWVGSAPPKCVREGVANLSAQPEHKGPATPSAASGKRGTRRGAPITPTGCLSLLRSSKDPPRIFFPQQENDDCHWACWIPVFTMLAELGLILDSDATSLANLYFAAIKDVSRGLKERTNAHLQGRLRNLRRVILRGTNGETSKGDPLALTRALLRTGEAQAAPQITSNTHVHSTGVAIGIAFAWTAIGCPKHKGDVVPFDQGYKAVDDGQPLRLKRLNRNRPSVQDVVDAMATDVAGDDPPSKLPLVEGDHWHFAERYCIGCHEDGTPLNAVRHKLRLRSHGPSHFIAEVPQGGAVKKGHSAANPGGINTDFGYDDLYNVEPSLELEIFGQTYMLCAIVYHRPQRKGIAAHFVAQAYLPTHKCWVTCDSCSPDGQAQCGPQFNDKFFRGLEYLFVYVAKRTLLDKDCYCEVYSFDEDSSSSDGRRQGPDAKATVRRDGRPVDYVSPTRTLATVLGDVTAEEKKQVDFEYCVESQGDEIVACFRTPPGEGRGRGRRGQDLTVSSTSFKSLQGTSWLRDECITAYFGLLERRDHEISVDGGTRRKDLFLTSMFLGVMENPPHFQYDYDTVKGSTKNLRIHPLRAGRIFFANNSQNSHWNLIVIDMVQQRITCYDSANFGAMGMMRKLRQWLHDLSLDATNEERALLNPPPDDEFAFNWGIEHDESSPKQTNSDDCGVFMLCFANMLSSTGTTEGVVQEAMPHARIKIASQILKRKL